MEGQVRLGWVCSEFPRRERGPAQADGGGSLSVHTTWVQNRIPRMPSPRMSLRGGSIWGGGVGHKASQAAVQGARTGVPRTGLLSSFSQGGGGGGSVRCRVVRPRSAAKLQGPSWVLPLGSGTETSDYPGK